MFEYVLNFKAQDVMELKQEITLKTFIYFMLSIVRVRVCHM